METLLLVLTGSLGVLFLWGLISPRSQWRLLVSWTYRDPHANEPTGSAYGLYRVVAAVGIVTMAVSGVMVYQARLGDLPPATAPPSEVERMWGTPNPLIVNRVVDPLAVPPKGLVDQPILGYQAVDGQHRQPVYLFGLRVFSLPMATTENGLIGSDPPAGLVALDTAQLVVEVAGDPQCFPHRAVVIEGSKTVRIGVYYGQANPPDGSNRANVADCNTKASGQSVTALLPITLERALGDRELQTLGGDPILRVRTAP